MAATTAAAAPTEKQPRIPDSYLDFPTQRLYSLSLGLLCQAIKMFDFVQYLFGAPSSGPTFTRKWILADAVYVLGLSQLRIPRLNYSRSVVVLQLLSLTLLDGFLFGGVRLNVLGGEQNPVPKSGNADLPSTPPPLSFSSVLSSIGLNVLVPSSDADSHLLGQHTVRMSPVSTAHINPDHKTFCLPTSGAPILIPILLNNTTPTTLRYSVSPLGASEEVLSPGKQAAVKVQYFDLSSRDLKAIEHARVEALAMTHSEAKSQRKSEMYDEDGYDDEEDEGNSRPIDRALSSLQRTQSLAHIRITKPGVIRLERVIHASSIDARVAYPSSVSIAPCPTASFVDDSLLKQEDPVRCAGNDPDVNLVINVFGVPPLSLRWHKTVNDKRESFMVEGIEAGHRGHGHDAEEHKTSGNLGSQAERGVPQELTVPLTVSVEAVGTHAYALESVVDGLGNVVHLGPEATSSLVEAVRQVTHPLHGHEQHVLENNKITRSLRVLRRPGVSWAGCSVGSPATVLIGSETSLALVSKDADPLNTPLEVTLKYQPPPELEDKGANIISNLGLSSNKKLRPWTKTLTTEPNKRRLLFNASSPGEYVITGLKGKHCEGDVLSPEVCKVVELPQPKATIEWKRIHECSGDTGVSASLVLHGTPPFQVYYRSQRDKHAARELVKQFHGSRGEITLQPEHSGHYTFSFVALSDANYKKIALDGPSIDQIVHPLASVDFANKGTRKINSCSGNTVDVDIELKGTGPWKVEAQVVSPKGTKKIEVPEIDTALKTLHITLPEEIDAEGGNFSIDLVSVEDTYGCKRTVSVPGIVVNVRRVKPSVKFYGQGGKHQVTIHDQEQAKLPLRLTGEGPWKVRYRRTQSPEVVLTAALTTPNDHLVVNEKGVYELVGVTDSQCPGSVVAEESQYQVDWILRPSAKFAPGTPVTLDPYTGSYSLPDVCETKDDHVDLELTGRPPFQVMYNIGKDSAAGGTDLVDQPTFNSIQPRTRFQLYTSEPGRKYYEVKQIGDAAYPLGKHKDAIIPRSERLLFIQNVLSRPSAHFKTRTRISYCLGDSFTPRGSHSDGLVVLQGTPPFKLKISVKNMALSETHEETITVYDKSWKVEIPAYIFKAIGPHMVSIDSVQDTSSCEQAIDNSLYQSIWVDVAESATIVPFDRREHFCVGDVSQFQLEGTPPWTIGYKINGKSQSQEAKHSPFSLVQQQPGDFAVTSIAHQHKFCKTAVTDLRYTVHPLPSAKVGHGKRIIQDIHEGDQAEILFTLQGEPPFTFTYQRSEIKSGKSGKVLETHTVSGVSTKEYSVYSALEGTWTVTFIADRYCRYPPLATDAR